MHIYNCKNNAQQVKKYGVANVLSISQKIYMRQKEFNFYYVICLEII